MSFLEAYLHHSKQKPPRSWPALAYAAGAVPRPSFTDVVVKDYSRLPKLDLPLVDGADESFLSVLKDRRTKRDLTEALTLSDLSRLLRYSLGVKADKPTKRHYPAAGGLHCLNTYVQQNTDKPDWPAGCYYYDPVDHCLYQISRGSTNLEGNTIDNDVYQAKTLIYLTLTLSRLYPKYGERSYRYALLEAGAAMQNLYLVATAEDLKVVALGSLIDGNIEAALEIDGNDESLAIGLAVGK